MQLAYPLVRDIGSDIRPPQGAGDSVDAELAAGVLLRPEAYRQREELCVAACDTVADFQTVHRRPLVAPQRRSIYIGRKAHGIHSVHTQLDILIAGSHAYRIGRIEVIIYASTLRVERLVMYDYADIDVGRRAYARAGAHQHVAHAYTGLRYDHCPQPRGSRPEALDGGQRRGIGEAYLDLVLVLAREFGHIKF